MKTDQEMIIEIGNNHTVKIGHKTKIGSLNDVLAIGNSYRREKGLREIELREWLRKESTWEFILEVELKYGTKFQTPESGVCLFDYKDVAGQLEYSKLIKQFSVIKSRRGGKVENRGVWANLQIMLDLAIYISPTLRLEMIDIFINSKILIWRDLGGDEYLELNKLIDKFPNSSGKSDRIKVSLAIRKKLEILDTRGYNKKEHNSFIQKKRTEYLNALQQMIEVGFITNMTDLKSTLKRLK